MDNYIYIYSIGIVSSVRNMAKVMFYLYNMAIKFKSHRHRHRTHTLTNFKYQRTHRHT